jgi:hypothetical protein
VPGVAGAVDVTLPSQIALVHAFVNTLDLRSFTYHGSPLTRHDHIASAPALATWLADHHLLPGDASVTEADAHQAVTLRSALRAALADDCDSSGDHSWPLRLVMTPGRSPALAPAGSGAAAALGTILVQVAGAVAGGQWSRLKVCAAEDCRWVFYDRSRPGRSRWCDPQLCGNRMKTRAYRARQHRTTAG